MAVFPQTPPPSKVSSPEIIDPKLEMTSDQGYSIRRSKRSRPLRRYTLDYLGRTTQEMRQMRDFFYFLRFGVFEFEFYHPTAFDMATILNTTPVIVSSYIHGLYTGQWIFVQLSANTSLNNHVWQVTTIDAATLSLNGSSAGGTSLAKVGVYMPRAVGIFQDDTWQSPVTLIGPEQLLDTARGPAGRSGYFNYSITIEELF